jgi:ribosomal protein S18 acetylase RimI-like enzyme
MLERSPIDSLPSGYTLRQGSTLERALLLKFMHRTYLELSADENLDHLNGTVEQYFSQETPLWWVEQQSEPSGSQIIASLPSSRPVIAPIACLWAGTAIDQRSGDRHAHIFLLYVDPKHRRQGIGAALMQQAEDWAIARGDHQIGLQVFQSNRPALTLYQHLGYQVQSLWMVKPLPDRDRH